MSETLEILYRDEHLVVVHKPSGLLTHRSILDRHETRFAVQILRDQIGQKVWPAHRLDKGTSGILIFALSAEIASTIGKAFESGEVAKTYVAIVRGHPPESGVIDHPLTRQRDEYEGGPASAQQDAAQSAVTRFRRLGITEQPWAVPPYPTSRYALLELEPLSGRRHQIRRHLKHIAHPIVGDSTYGKGLHNRLFGQHLGCQRLFLACTAVALPHPVSGEVLRIVAPLSADFAAIVHRLGWEIAPAA